MKKVILCAISAFSAFECTAMNYKDSGALFVQAVRRQIDASRNIEPGDLVQADHEGKTLLFYVAASDSVDALKVVVRMIRDESKKQLDKQGKASEQKQPKLEQRDNYGRSVIHIAVDNNSIKSLSWLLRNEEDGQDENEKAEIREIRDKIGINCRDHDGMTPLMNAAANSNLGIMQLLIARNAIIGLSDYKGNNILHFLTSSNNVEAIEAIRWVLSDECQAIMLQQNEDYRDQDVLTLVRRGNDLRNQLAYEFRQDDVANLLRSFNASRERPIDVAAAAGKWELVDLFWDESLRLLPYNDEKNIASLSPLIVALCKGNGFDFLSRIEGIVRDNFTEEPEKLLKVLVNSSNNGVTAIRAAISSGCKPCVLRLLSMGAELSDEDLDIIIKEGNNDMLQFLHDQELFEVDSKSMISAIQGGDSELIRLFILCLGQNGRISAEVVREACSSGFELDIVRSLVEHCDEKLGEDVLSPVFNERLRRDVLSPAFFNLDLLKYLIEDYEINLSVDFVKKLVKTSLLHSRSKVQDSLEYLLENHPIPANSPLIMDKDFLTKVLPNFFRDTLLFLIDRNYIPMFPDAIPVAFHYKDMPLLSDFLRRGAEVSDESMITAIETRSFFILKNILDHRRTPLQPEVITRAIECSFLEAFDFFIHRINIPSDTLKVLAINGHISYLDCIVDTNLIKRIVEKSEIDASVLQALANLACDQHSYVQQCKWNPSIYWVNLALARVPVEDRALALNIAADNAQLEVCKLIIKGMNAEHIGTEAFHNTIRGIIDFPRRAPMFLRNHIQIAYLLAEHGAKVCLQDVRAFLSFVAKFKYKNILKMTDLVVKQACSVDCFTLRQAVAIGDILIVESVLKRLELNEEIADEVLLLLEDLLKNGNCDAEKYNIVKAILRKLPVTQRVIDTLSGKVDMETLRSLCASLDANKDTI